MVIIEQLRLNKFVNVSIPSPRSYFQRLGAGEIPASDYSGEEMVRQGNKVDNLALMDERDRQFQKEEASEE